MLSTPLITTKFQIPLTRADLVPRQRLHALLDAGSRQPLTMISASPGFGKTMLVANWIHSQNKSGIAWLSLDESDDLSALFWRYFITALQQCQPGIGETAQAMLSTPEPLAMETVLAPLINELAAMDEPLIVVIDDYHVIQSPDIHNSLNFYLDHQPANVHLMLLTREDPPLALARRRARRQMIEIRAADLRFDESEAAAFLNAAMGLTLAPEQVASLECRTEGWIVGLQMAALSMQGRDPQAFLDSFAGDDRYIADYLIEEVLNRQSEAVRDFLLRTSILEKLSTPLCMAVLGEPPSVELADLDRANLFLIPLDNTRSWYRYHHLFADLLRQCLGDSVSAEEIGRLYRDASEWCEAHGEIHAAIRYARQIPDETHVVELLHQYALLFFLQSELPQLVDFARALPPSLLEEDPHLCMAIAWAMIGTRQNPETWLGCIERHFGLSAESALSEDGLDDERRAALLEVLIVRQQSVFYNPVSRDRARLLSMQERLEQLPAGQPCLFSTVTALQPVLVYNLGFDMELAGEVKLAADYLTQAIALSREAGNPQLLQLSSAHLAQVQLAQGQLYAARRSYEQALAEASPGVLSPGASLAHAGLGNIHYEWGDLEKAEFHFQVGLPMARAWNQWEALCSIVTGLARARKRRGDLNTAIDLLDDFRPQNENLLVMTEALRLLWAAQGSGSASIGQWLAAHSLSAITSPTPFNESLLLDVTRMFIAMDRIDDALAVSQKVLASAGEGGRNHWVIQANILQAKIFAAQGKTPDAVTSLNKALHLAEPENYLSAFVDEGDTVRALLAKVTGNAYVAGVLAGFSSGGELPAKHVAVAEQPDVLSEREREVLRLVAVGYSNQQIAERLVISITTVKTHMGNIFNKLGVTSRTQALARAESLGLLPQR